MQNTTILSRIVIRRVVTLRLVGPQIWRRVRWYQARIRDADNYEISIGCPRPTARLAKEAIYIRQDENDNG